MFENLQLISEPTRLWKLQPAQIGWAPRDNVVSDGRLTDTFHVSLLYPEAKSDTDVPVVCDDGMVIVILTLGATFFGETGLHLGLIEQRQISVRLLRELPGYRAFRPRASSQAGMASYH